jgi:SAM-dependent methyltransferase
MLERAVREQTYWDEAYRSAGDHHAKYLWTKHIEQISFIGERFAAVAGNLKRKRILSIGGGVDRLGVSLAKAGNRVLTVDVSPIACAATLELARQEDVQGNLTSLVAAGEEVELQEESFDVVIFKRSLHHMDLPTIIGHVHRILVPSGFLLAEEPVCLPGWLRRVHTTFPFHPEAVRTTDEQELTPEDLNLIRRTFRQMNVSYFDCFARESVAYFLYQARIEGLLRLLGKLDYVVMNRYLPVTRYLSTYIIIHAVK